MPTPSVENYLKAVYHLQHDGDERVKTKQMAEQLDISLPSVTSMLKSLAEEGLVDYRPYKGARLTETGIKAALRVIRNHRLIEVFLVHTLGYGWDEVHDEAERLEHSVSEKLVSRIDDFLGHPKFDPHGDPIPSARGQLANRRLTSLAACPLDTPVTVARIADQDADFLNFAHRSGLLPGTAVRVTGRDPAAESVTLRLEPAGKPVTIGTAAAEKVLVDAAAPAQSGRGRPGSSERPERTAEVTPDPPEATTSTGW
jgi:DtxR family Mn-dependent transcriptional regulator